MNKTSKVIFISLSIVFLFSVFLYAQKIESEQKIKIATFNIQIFGKTKRAKNDVMDVLVKTVRNFDIIAIQEFRDKTMTTLPYFVEKINDVPRDKYKYEASERLGRTNSKERYAFIYNTETIKFNDIAYVYDDIDDVFEREPFVAFFSAGNFDFVLINIHVKPDDATREIDYLHNVVNDAKTRISKEGDFIILGDLNADCSYFKEELDTTSVETDEYLWLVDDNQDTTVGTNSCAYDRIIVTKQATSGDYADMCGVFHFDEEYGLNKEFSKKVSYHYPVWAEFFTGKDDD